MQFNALLWVEEPFVINIFFVSDSFIFFDVILVVLQYFIDARNRPSVFATFPSITDDLTILILTKYLADVNFSKVSEEFDPLHVEDSIFQIVHVETAFHVLRNVGVINAESTFPFSVAPWVPKFYKFESLVVKNV